MLNPALYAVVAASSPPGRSSTAQGLYGAAGHARVHHRVARSPGPWPRSNILYPFYLFSVGHDRESRDRHRGRWTARSRIRPAPMPDAADDALGGRLRSRSQRGGGANGSYRPSAVGPSSRAHSGCRNAGPFLPARALSKREVPASGRLTGRDPGRCRTPFPATERWERTCGRYRHSASARHVVARPDPRPVLSFRRGVEQRQLVGLITRRSLVRIQSPQPTPFP